LTGVDDMYDFTDKPEEEVGEKEGELSDRHEKEKGNGVRLLLTENDEAHHLLKIIEVSQEDDTSSKPNKRSPNGTRKEQVTLSKSEKSIRDLATAGHDYLRMYIATENAFPDSTGKAAFSWKRLEEAISSNHELKLLKDEALKVEKTKEICF